MAHADIVSRAAHRWFEVPAGAVIVAGIIYAGCHVADDLSVDRDTRACPLVLLGLVPVIALGCEFVNGVHGTATTLLPNRVRVSVANHSGLQCATVRNLVNKWAWLLPLAAALADGLYG